VETEYDELKEQRKTGQYGGLTARKAQNRNLSYRQMGGNLVRNAIGNATANQQIFNHFTHAGIGSAIRFAVGAPAMPENLVPYYRANLYQKAGGAENLYGDEVRPEDTGGGEGE
jgi:hypothetical protein